MGLFEGWWGCLRVGGVVGEKFCWAGFVSQVVRYGFITRVAFMMVEMILRVDTEMGKN